MKRKYFVFFLISIFCFAGFTGCHKKKKHRKRANQVEWVVSEEEEEQEQKEDDEDAFVVEDVDIKQVATVHVGLPLQYMYITSEYGERVHPVTNKKSFHSGVDLAAGQDTTVAMMPGIIESIGQNDVAGKYIVVKHGSLSVTYCHLSEILVKENYKVIAGSKIGITGATGRVTGEHLHLACKIDGQSFDPILLLQLLRCELTDENSQ